MKRRYCIGLQIAFLIITILGTIFIALLGSPFIELLLKETVTSEEAASLALMIVLFLPLMIIGGIVDVALLISNICLAASTVKNAFGSKRTFGFANLILSIVLLLILLGVFVIIALNTNNIPPTEESAAALLRLLYA